MIRERQRYRGRSQREGRGQPPQVDKWRKSAKTTVGQDTPGGVEWCRPHIISPRARPHSIDQPGVYTSDNTSQFVRNYLKWRQINPIHPLVGHVPLDSPDGGKIHDKVKNTKAKLPSSPTVSYRKVIPPTPPQPFGG